MWDGVGDVYKLYIIQEFADVGTLTAALGECVGRGPAAAAGESTGIAET